MQSVKHRGWVMVMCIGGSLCAAAAGTLQPNSTLNPGGNSRQVARYTLDDAIGGWAQVAETESGNWVKPDFCGALIDPTSLEISSPANQFAEEHALQLSARLRCDDGSYLSAGIDANWQVLSGPLLSGGDGWMTAQPVYRQSNATVQATSAGLSGQLQLLVLNTHLDNYGLYAADGIDDDWQVHYFGLDNPNGLRGADPDGDGTDNYYEFAANTDPGLASDSFALAIHGEGYVYYEPDPENPTNTCEVVHMCDEAVKIGLGPLATGRTYRVERASELMGSTWSGVTNIVVASAESFRYLSSTQTETETTFYRVIIDHPWRATP